jgi:phosphoenolpyruvate carboxykinase (ATP)
MVRAALNGELASVPTRVDPVFGLAVPLSCPEVPAEFLSPRDTWQDRDAYDSQARLLAEMFTENFALYASEVDPPIRDAGPRIIGPLDLAAVDELKDAEPAG